MPRWAGYTLALIGGLLLADIAAIVAFGESTKIFGQPYTAVACMALGILAQIAKDLQGIAGALTSKSTGSTASASADDFAPRSVRRS